MPESRQQMMPSIRGRSDKLHNHVCDHCILYTFTIALTLCTLRASFPYSWHKSTDCPAVACAASASATAPVQAQAPGLQPLAAVPTRGIQAAQLSAILRSEH